MSATRKLLGGLGIAAGIATLAFALAGAGSAFGQVGTPTAATTGTPATTTTTTAGTPTTEATTPAALSTPSPAGTSITHAGTPTTSAALPSTGAGPTHSSSGISFWLVGLGAAAALLGTGALVAGRRRRS